MCCFLQTLLHSLCATTWMSRSHNDQDTFLGHKDGHVPPASEKQKRKFENHRNGRSAMKRLLGAEAIALGKAKSMVAAEIAMESQAADYADRVASEAEAAEADMERIAARAHDPVGDSATREPDDNLQLTPELAHASQVYDLGGATVAEWAAKAAQAEAEAQVVPFSHKAEKHSGRHDAHRHAVPVSRYEFEVRLHGLRTAKQAADAAHSWKLALKLRRQIAELEDLEEHPQEEIPKDGGDLMPEARQIACFSEEDGIRAQHLQQQIDDMEQSMKRQADYMARLQQQIDSVKLTPAGGVEYATSSPSSTVPHMQQLKMFSAKQRLSKDDALALYRLGHVVGVLLDRHQVAWWATGGTLLGAVRNKGIIPHDDDIDYSMLNDQSEILLSKSFKDDLGKNGLTMHRVQEGFWQIFPAHKNGSAPLHVDIFAMWRTFSACCQKNVICHPHQWWHKHTFPVSLCSPVSGSRVPEQNKNISCPLLRRWPFGKSGSVWGPPPEIATSYLNHVYGTDWQTVARCQDTNHPCGLVENATYDATEALEPSGPLEEPL
jgi:hypothetical protein